MMKSSALLLFGISALPFVAALGDLPAIESHAPHPWSEPVGGLQTRITLVEKPRLNGTRWLVPYLELRNVGDSGSPLQVRCGSGHVRFELVNAEGKVIRDGTIPPRSGPHPDPGTVSLPLDSWMQISMECRNWGVPRDAAAMISTDSGAWVLQPQEQGTVFLRATLTGAKAENRSDPNWRGTIVTPAVTVDWQK